MQPETVLNLAFTQVVQMRPPVTVLPQIIRNMLGEKNVPGIAAIHDPLRDVDSCSRNVGPVVHISHLVNRPAMNAHADTDFRVTPQFLPNLERALRRLFGTAKEKQGHPVASGQADELSVHLSLPKAGCATHDAIELLNQFYLLVYEQRRITDNVDQQEMSDLKLEIWLWLSGHGAWAGNLLRAPMFAIRRHQVERK